MSSDEILMEDKAPSVDSPILEERIAARRLRIACRLEMLKIEAGGEDKTLFTKFSEPVKEPSKSRKQMEQTHQRLSKLISDGNELVSNVEVACDAREAALRSEQDESGKARTEKLKDGIKIATMKFEEITKRWEETMKKEIPQDLQKMLTSQQYLCDQMIDDKNKLINELQQNLKQKDDQYVKDLRKQAEDADLMLERMDEQMKTLRQAYAEELDNIESAFYSERTDLCKGQKDKWSEQTNLRKQKEVEYTETREKRVDDFNNQLQLLRVQDAEEYNMVKIKLETDVQILEQNLQQMKATYQLNQEKLEYNFQVLKKRDEENTITKSQQKRKITRLQDLLNNLKQKLKKQEQQYKDDNQGLSDDLKRMTEQHKELQKKFRHFQATDRKKFIDIWKMNEEQLKQLVADVLEEDRIIFEHQLGMDWHPPDLEFLKNVGPLEGKKLIAKSALDTVQEVISLASDDSVASEDVDKMSVQMTDGYKLSVHCMKNMLELLCDESGFLVESKLLKLLAPIEKDEQSLMKLDAIFNAIGVETEQDIIQLSKFLFKPTSTMPKVDSTENPFVNEEMVPSPPELIHPNDVIKALRMFVENNKEPFREVRRQSTLLKSADVRDDSMDEQYWQQLSSVISEKKERLWGAMIDGFDKYGTVLTERAKLIQDTDSLRQQNGELRVLLHQYLSSKVNQELEIPPTRVLQLEITHK